LLGFAAGGVACVAVIGAIWFALVRDPEAGGRAIATVIQGGKASTPAGPPAGSTGSIATTPGLEPGSPEDRIGLTEIVPDGGLSEVGADTIVITDANSADPVMLAAAPLEELSEDSPFGVLPQIGPNGERPMDLYARPTDPRSSGRRIAIVVGGIGIGENGTDAAIDGLPGAVTLALAPYGKDLPTTLARARAAGHEILMQIPLEPFGYPNNDPGPHTLTVAASEEENLERLHWLMSRATTYVGVMNYLGARFTSEEAALEPVIAEVGERGLLYFDDGSSGMSRADRLAKGRTPFARADTVIDAQTEAKAIDERLAEVEAIARQRGYAIATATAFPVTIERIAKFAKSAADRGFEIVPLTALVDPDRP
jgi:polysaccharide deacetylase 2 family uncharacterized protein YibQ